MAAPGAGVGTALAGAATGGAAATTGKFLSSQVGGSLLSRVPSAVTNLAGYGVAKGIQRLTPAGKAEARLMKEARATAAYTGTSDKHRLAAQKAVEGDVAQLEAQRGAQIEEMIRAQRAAGGGFQSGLIGQAAADIADTSKERGMIAGQVHTAAEGAAAAEKQKAQEDVAAHAAQQQAELMAVLGVGQPTTPKQDLMAQQMSGLRDDPQSAALRQLATTQANVASQ